MMSQEKPQSSGNQKRCFEDVTLIDTGTKLTHKKYALDLSSVLVRAKEASVRKIIVSGTSVENSMEALRLARRYSGTIYSTAGVHPHDAKSMVKVGLWSDLYRIAQNPECVAIGKCGLNYSKGISEPYVQRDVFKLHVEMACELQKPLFIHEKGAQDDLITILEGFGSRLPPVVIYSFCESFEEGLRYIEKGFYMGISGSICQNRASGGTKRLLAEKRLPLDQLLVESDSPFMSPCTKASKVPFRVKNSLTRRSLYFVERYCPVERNEPCALPAIVDLVASYTGYKPVDVALATTANALKLFGVLQ